jgi:hypothetical protein
MDKLDQRHESGARARPAAAILRCSKALVGLLFPVSFGNKEEIGVAAVEREFAYGKWSIMQILDEQTS